MINPSEYQYEESVWQDIYKCLKNAGIEVYAPGIKVGECTRKYVVVKNDGASRHPEFSTDEELYAVMCYVPKQAYSTLEPFVREVQEVLSALRPMIKPTGVRTPSYYDDTYKAHMVSVSYRNYKKVI